jgi:DNA-binding CsgD family transcriptional regulator
MPRPGSTMTVTYNGRPWRVGRGDHLTVGRGRDCAIRLPDDTHFSRNAAVLRILDDCVLITNTSTSKPFVLRPPVGEDRIVEPGGATTSLPYPTFDIVIAGRGVNATVQVDASSVGASPVVGPSVTGSLATEKSPVEFTPTQHRVLIALCRPMLTASGSGARPATYAEIGDRLGLSPQYVRNVIKVLRESLSGYGIPGIVPGAVAAPNDDFRLPLARWAVWNGWVAADDLDDRDD